ncbi:MAG: tetratricopeptide repeat protein [Bacteroidia bacterium]|nr:tetratricopeptide repeat protein [Bacteroidia bacterium]
MTPFARLLLLLLSLLAGGSTLAANLDSLRAALAQHAQAQDAQGLIRAHQALGLALRNQFEYAAALEQFEAAIRVAEAGQPPPELLFELLNQAGELNFWQDRYTPALEQLLRARELGVGQVDKPSQASNLSRIAEVYVFMGNYKQALYFQLQSLELSELAGDSMGIAQSLQNIGTIYFHREQYDLSLDYLQRALSIYLNTDQQRATYTILAAIASNYEKKAMPERGLPYARQSLDLARQMDYSYGVAFSTGMTGVFERLLGQLGQAELHIRECLQGMRRLGARSETADFSIELARVYLARQDYRAALDTLTAALAVAQEIQSRKLQADIYKYSAEAQERLGNTPAALELFRRYDVQRDSLLNEKNLEQMANMESEFELQRQQRQIERLKEQERLTRTRVYLISFVAGAGLLGMIIWLLYSRYRAQVQLNAMLAEQRDTIQRSNEELAASNAELSQFAELASRDLRAPLTRILESAAGLEAEALSEAGERALGQLQRSAGRIDSVLAGMSLYSVTGLQQDPPERVDLSEAVSAAIAQLPEPLRKHGARISMSGLPVVLASRRQMVQLFQQLISNAIRFRSEREPEIRISSTQSGSWYSIAVQDNGRGIAPEDQTRIFQVFSRVEDGSSAEGLGIGLALCKRIVEQYRGKIRVSSVPGEGSTFYITLPIPPSA